MSGLELLALPPVVYGLAASGVGAGGAYAYHRSVTAASNADQSEQDEKHVLDPRTEAYWETFHKACVNFVGSVGARNVVQFVPLSDTVFHYDVEEAPGVRGLVALTIDDAPCRQRASDRNMVLEVRDLLRTHGALATFFLCSDHLVGHEADMVNLLADGHEVANHCARDRVYANDSEEDFEKVLLRSEAVCEQLRRQAAATAARRSSCLAGPLTSCLPCKAGRREGKRSSADPLWFRAPGAALSPTMSRVLDQHGYTHVLCDCYANDPWISDPEFIAETMLDHAHDGSILVVHMPERGFREYTLEAIRRILVGLRERGLRSVTLTELHNAAKASAPAAAAAPQSSS